MDWQKLWYVATGEEGGSATIEVDDDRPDHVVLTWPDGSRGAWKWVHSENNWRACGDCGSYARNAHTTVGGEGE